jgi:hypothetical protein
MTILYQRTITLSIPNYRCLAPNLQEHYATKFSIRNITDGDFKKKTRLPIKALSLRETEELVIHRPNKGIGARQREFGLLNI